jgi:DNA-binding transcriptional ArsR family regulator
MKRRLDLLPVELLADVTECLKVLAHPLRLRIVDILMQAELPVHEIARLCGLATHQTSEHLRLLQGRGLLASQRRGRAVYYRVADPRLPALLGCIRKICGAKANAGRRPEARPGKTGRGTHV